MMTHQVVKPRHSAEYCGGRKRHDQQRERESATDLGMQLDDGNLDFRRHDRTFDKSKECTGERDKISQILISEGLWKLEITVRCLPVNKSSPALPRSATSQQISWNLEQMIVSIGTYSRGPVG